jgi:hypothetical protein
VTTDDRHHSGFGRLPGMTADDVDDEGRALSAYIDCVLATADSRLMGALTGRGCAHANDDAMRVVVAATGGKKPLKGSAGGVNVEGGLTVPRSDRRLCGRLMGSAAIAQRVELWTAEQAVDGLRVRLAANEITALRSLRSIVKDQLCRRGSRCQRLPRCERTVKT